MIGDPSIVNRMRLFRASLLIIMSLVIFAWQMHVPSGKVVAAKGAKGLIFDIVPDNSASTLTASAARGTTFYMQGTIFAYRTVNQADCTLSPTAAPLGTWRAWGTVADGGKLTLHQTLSFDRPEATPFNASIEVQGVNGVIAPNGSVTFVDKSGATTGPSEVLTVVGGSGAFSALDGEAIIRPYCNPTPAGSTPFRFDRPFCLGVE